MKQILYVCQTEAAANAKFKELVAVHNAEVYAEQSNHQRRWLWLPNGVTYDVRTVNSDIRGMSYDKVIVDELAELDEEQRSFLKSRERPNMTNEQKFTGTNEQSMKSETPLSKFVQSSAEEKAEVMERVMDKAIEMQQAAQCTRRERKMKDESHLPVSEQSLVFRLRKRAEIRRQIPSRKSVEEGKPDRIADLLEEAADEIERLQGFIANAVADKLTR